jgi:hypothetical protein
MLTSMMSAELVAARHTELIAAAEAERLAPRVGCARRDERRFATAARFGRIWLRPRTPDASPDGRLIPCASRPEPGHVRSAGVAVGDKVDVQLERASAAGALTGSGR